MTIPNTEFSFVWSDVSIALIAFLFLYLTYYFGSDFGVVKRYRNRYGETNDRLEQSVYLRRTMGFVLLGVIPLLIAVLFFEGSLTSYGIGFPTGPNVVLWALIPTALILVVSLVRSESSLDLDYYPEVRIPVWTRRKEWINAAFWALYLLGYEFAIRGFLFFSCLYAFGLWPAIVINVVIYSLIHIFKGAGEAYGAFFLGILFCLMTYYTNSIWLAFINHVLLAVLNDGKAVRAIKHKK